jgi:rhodanese-related sulfurtransferase
MFVTKLKAKLTAKHDELLKSKLPPEEVAKLIKNGALLIDVRTKFETRRGNAPGATHFSLLSLKRHMDELPRDRNIVLFCGTGGRAGKAKQILDAAGFKAFNGGGYQTIKKILENK